METSGFTRGMLLVVSAIVSVVFSVPAGAEDRRLTLEQAIEFSLKNNGELKAFRDEGDIRAAGKVRAVLPPNPVVDLEGATGALTGSSAENFVSIGVSQEFLVNGKRGKRLDLAEREVELFRWQVADRERVLRREVKESFYDALLARERLALAEKSIDLNRQLFEVARERFTAGDIPELELNLVKVELGRSQASRIEAAIALKQAEARLATLMGLPAGPSPALAGSLEPQRVMKKTVAELLQLARSRRPDLKALEAEKGRGEAESILARAEAVPNLTAGLALQREATAMEVGGLQGRETAYLVAVKLSMPIPVFDRNQASIQEARARTASSESRLQAARVAVDHEVETAYAALVSADDVLALYKSGILPQFEENLTLTRDAYRLGETGILSVIQEDRKFLDVNDAFLKALHDRQTALAKLESAVATDPSGGAQ